MLLMLMVLPLRAATKDVLFARILPDRTTLYAGDSMLVSVVLYATAPIAKAECTSQFVVQGKCDVRKLDIDRNATAGRTREGRQMYYTLVWNQYVVAPQKTGTYTIPVQKFKATLQRLPALPSPFSGRTPLPVGSPCPSGAWCGCRWGWSPCRCRPH